MKKSAPPLWLMTQQQTAELVGKPSRWIRDSSIPRKDDGKYDAREVVAWMVGQHSTSNLQESKLLGQIKVLKERIRRYRRYELEEVVPVDLVRDLLLVAVGHVTELADEFEQIPEIAGKDAQAMLNKKLNSQISEMNRQTDQ